jgi:hypothetical protein
VGHEPFTELVLEAKGEEVLTLRGNLVSDLRALQGQRVQVQGTIIHNQDFLYSSKGLLVETYNQQPLGGDN